MFGVWRIWSIKYRDIELASESPLTSMTTRRAYLEKYIADWPAELAPPTMYTSSSLQEIASAGPAP